jgi:YbbR domain-containing protein
MRINAHDLLLRLLSVALALLLWFAVAGQKNAEIAVAAPIEFRNMPAGLELVGTVPRAVEIWLRGSPGLIQRLRPGEVYVPLDLTGAQAGSRVVHLASGEIRVPYGVRIAAIRPASFVLDMERSVRRTVAVKPVLVGQPAPGHHVVAVMSQPAEVTIAGPESRLATLDGIGTEPVSVDRAQMTLVRDVSLLPPDVPLWLVDPQPVRVTVRVERDDEAKH